MAARPQHTVVLVHNGDQPYVRRALRTAVANNNRAVKIGMDLADYDPAFAKFSEIYQHMSTNAEHFELLCFKRYFALINYMMENNLDFAFLMDSDLMLFHDVSQDEFLVTSNCALSIPSPDDDISATASPHISFWSLSALRNFIEYILSPDAEDLESMNRKWQWHVENNRAGGICDMTYLYFWSKRYARVFNTARVLDGSVYDHSIQRRENYRGENYIMSGPLKRIVWKNGNPHFLTSDGNPIRAKAMHFQGKTKRLMRFIDPGISLALDLGLRISAPLISRHTT